MNTEHFLRWAGKQYTERQKNLFLSMQGIFFIFIIPLALWFSGRAVDARFGLPALIDVPLHLYIGIPVLALGLFFCCWAVWVEFKIGKGTPAPLMPTQKLVVVPPYTYCRNPMGLGFGIMLVGLGAAAGSPSAILLGALIFSLLLCYYKFIEEEELEARFGGEYLEYRKRVPFLFPKFR